MLLGGDAAEMILARGKLRLVVEDRRVARMGDEIGEVAALRQVSGKGCGRIEDNQHCTGLQPVDNAGCHLADRRIRHRKDHDLRTIERGVERDRLEPELLCQPSLADLAHLDMANVEA
ncbi:hypothetical protein ABIA27_001004 [Sinorhizobium fredii]